MAHLPQLVRLLCDLRLAVLALAMITETVTNRSLLVTGLLLVGVLFSYLPLRGWERMSGLLSRRPLLLLLDVVVATCLLLVATTQLMLVYALATVLLGGLLSGRLGALLTSGLMAANMLLAAAFSELSGFATVESTMTLVVYALLYALSGFGSARLRRLLVDIDESHHLASLESARAAHAEERARLSREMHDGVSKTLHGMSLLATGLRRNLAEGRVEQGAELADQLGNAARVAANDSRRLLADLRSDRPSEPLDAAFRRVVEDWAAGSGVDVGVLEVQPDVELGTGARYEVLCIVGEALENVARHAGAGRVEARLDERDGWVTIGIADDGRGCAVAADPQELGRAGHYGVLGMHERASRIGGRLELRARPPHGTEVRLRVPVALATSGGRP